MKIALITLFPNMFEAISEYGISGRAVKNGLVELAYFNPRDFTEDKHRTIDDRPYGGGPGMVMLVEPLRKAALMREQLNVLMIGFHEVTARVGDQRSVLRDAACVEVSRSFRGFEVTASRSDSVQRRPRGGGSLRCHGGWASRG